MSIRSFTTKMPRRAPITPASSIPSLSLLYKLHKLAPAAPGTALSQTLIGPNTGATLPTPSKSLNDRVGLIRTDITSLAVDAIVNAANRSLLGGGAVDGVIHAAAGPQLYDECRTLHGCATGSAKITNAYLLPCKKVIHAVGPVYDASDPAKSERLLTGCYTKSLELAAEHGCRTVAFSALSTGIYGYPSREAAPAALSAIRKFLVRDGGKGIDKVVIVTYVANDVAAYDEFLPLYFPPASDDDKTQTNDESETSDADEAKLEAEAKAVAQELPSAPTTDPSDDGRARKKQKQKGL
ncbi:hypothetical protein NEMBOFW57_007679 [Staphylotrichum longicolle]|uniref:Macro domain-containing protein n=1 Tax=Staphylotrichum longicolle TaxID=669026 RepID=A0AAD4HVC1_9PEZI|nr:hypothetical protein NEMBOFW57_007679 [Staphylotrichum longicolle]